MTLDLAEGRKVGFISSGGEGDLGSAEAVGSSE